MHPACVNGAGVATFGFRSENLSPANPLVIVMKQNLKFYSRKLIKPGDLNARNTLFGGALLRWIDEEAGIYAMAKLDSRNVVTKYMSEINFVSSAKQGDVIEIGLGLKWYGRTSISFSCEVRNLFTKETISQIENIIFVHVDAEGRPTPHNAREASVFMPRFE